jgi:hypothetical protein
LTEPRRRLALAATCLTLSACTDADIMLLEDSDLPLMRVRLRAEICAPPAFVDPLPHKILFVIDTSGSTSDSDPTPPGGLSRREEAVRLSISEQIKHDGVSFGIITFSSTPLRQTYGFTRDLDVLNGAAANIGTAQGGTDYSDTVWEVIHFIADDLATLTPARAARTQYEVYWLSDGEPTVGATSSDPIRAGMHFLRNSLDGKVAGFRFHTVFLGGALPDEAAVERARALLEDMAADGGGNFTDVAAGEKIDLEIEQIEVERSYVLASVVAYNRSAQFGPDHPLPDSDADGVVDADEELAGTDPLLSDSDENGVSDLVERELGGSSSASCASETDEDGDGLTDCEEALLGTAAVAPDSDGDLLPDWLEVALGSPPRDDSAESDPDLDGVSTVAEVRGHMPPNLYNSGEEIARWAYTYRVEELVADPTTGSRCYDLLADNIGVYQTAESSDGEVGDNQIELVVGFRPADGDDPIQTARTSVVHRFRLPDLHSPMAGEFRLNNADFVFFANEP